ncbi:DUF3179 domain-containing protein [Lipingzhangella sp. LS1_29]|uniref:DUF3179 domain-containing protein n=1 Tax=Lipingzhangella rawalii TaxID=2055835 RepID=A0ABU2H4C8_9ACTN|nr:DUF3179 domain-containing protein [Lipingzhangella rawalii]MDS1270163.1 DUF3179 domain-containing protein [Lipingzhangella rawalii]
MMRRARRCGIAAGVVGVLVVSACQPHTEPDRDPDGSGATAPDASDVQPIEDVVSALDEPASADLPEPLVDPDRLISGGPPPDGIPALDDPAMEPADEVDWLADDEPVLAVEVGGEHRAYPVQILMWHEIANDTIADVPVAVTYCPLCDSSLAFDRRVEGRVLDFGVSGMLYNSDLVMFDRQTHSLWPQIEGEAVAGALTGTELDQLSVAVLPWSVWREETPEGLVLSEDTGHDRDYGGNPYVGYDEPGGEPYLFDGEADDRLRAMERVVGIGAQPRDGDTDALAIPHEVLAEERVVTAEVDEEPVVVWAGPGHTSALDSARIAEGRQLGTTAAFHTRVDGQDLTFTPHPDEEDRFLDEETASTWTVLGEASAGPLEGEQLDAVDHLDTFWFAWASFNPETEILE